MGIVKLFLDLAASLRSARNKATRVGLEDLFTSDVSFAYIGNRRTRHDLVLAQISRIRERFLELDANALTAFSGYYPDLASVAGKLRAGVRNLASAPEDLARAVYGTNWQKNSGAYPDLVLGFDGTGALGDGAILELKDSEGAQLSSFNSTLPTRLKSLEEIHRITKSTLAVHSATLYTGV